jgi:hypothetical protein
LEGFEDSAPEVIVVILKIFSPEKWRFLPKFTTMYSGRTEWSLNVDFFRKTFFLLKIGANPRK